jgi:hypothetical protein
MVLESWIVRRLSAVAVSGLSLIALGPMEASAHGGPLPLGDGKVSSEPKVGHVMACNSRFPGGGGAHRVGDWIKDGSWHPDRKPRVEGEVSWPNARVAISVEGAERVVRANGLPRHASGTFPIRPGSAAHAYDRNPNRIAAQDVLLRLPAEPKPAAQPVCVPMGMIGFAVSGVAIFNAFDLAGRDAPAYEIQDRCNGHPERNGRYHYHDWSPCMVPSGHPANQPVGWMLDGFPILGPYDQNGRPFTNADLDACHGRVGEVEIDGRIATTYHYRFTLEYPYTIGCFRGTPVSLPRGPGGGAGGGGPSADVRARIITLAAERLKVEPDALRNAVGGPPPDYARASRMLNRPEAEVRAAMRAARDAAER